MSDTTEELEERISDIIRSDVVLATDNGQAYIRYDNVAVDKIVALVITQAKKDLLAEVREAIPVSMGKGLQPMYSKGYNTYRAQALANIRRIEEKL